MIILNPGNTSTVIPTATSQALAVSGLFDTLDSAVVLFTATKVGSFSTLTFNLQVWDPVGNQFQTLATWDAVASGTFSNYLKFNPNFYRLVCTGFVGGTSVAVTAQPASIMTGTTTSPFSIAALPAGSAVIGHVIADSGSTTVVTGTVTVGSHAVTNAGTFAVQAALNAETTKVIGTVNIAAAQHIIIDSGSTTVVTGTVTVGTHAVTQSGTWTVQPGNTPNTTPWLVTARAVGNTGATLDAAINGAAPTNALWATCAPSTASAAAMATPVTTASLTVVNIKASAGNVYGFSINNASAAVIFLQFYNTAGTPVLGTSVIFSVACPIGVTNFLANACAMANFATGIGIGASTTATSSGTPSVAPSVTIFFK
jgi:hypothetical protein